MTAGTIGPVQAMDAAFAGGMSLVDLAGIPRPIELRRWRGSVDATDSALLLARCHGRTIDVGCGPGRLVAGLAALDVAALGIDVSPEAVRQARRRGALALRRDVFAPVPGEGRWDCALLADGNIGIGGHPERLLRRLGRIVRPGGRVVVELDAAGTDVVHHRWRLASATASRRSSTGRRSAWTRSNGCRTQPASRSRTGPRRANATSRCCVGLLPDEGHRRHHRRADPTTPRFLEPSTRYPQAARVGILLGCCVGICFVTGLWSHFQYESPGWLPIGPRPAWLYRVPRPGRRHRDGGDPVGAGQLWSVYPRLFRRSRKGGLRALLTDGLERASVFLLVAAILFQLVTGSLNVVQWYPWDFSFRATHEAVAFVAVGAVLTHLAAAPVGAHRPAEPDRRSAVPRFGRAEPAGRAARRRIRPCSRCC